MDVLELRNFIDGEFFKTDEHLDSFNPSNGKVHAKVPDSKAGHVHQAIDAAKTAFKK